MGGICRKSKGEHGGAGSIDARQAAGSMVTRVQAFVAVEQVNTREKGEAAGVSAFWYDAIHSTTASMSGGRPPSCRWNNEASRWCSTTKSNRTFVPGRF